MFMELLKEYILSLAVQVTVYTVHVAICPDSVKGECLNGGFFFVRGRNMVDNHALRGHVFANVTVTEAVHCFRACQLDCRCTSFNYQQFVSKNNCQLNEENRYTNFSALEFAEGTQYYDLVIDYNIRANVPLAECQNGYCGSHPCQNGGTCNETCEVVGRRFTCSCGPHTTGRLCETAICSTPDWLRYRNSCFKGFKEKVNWFKAQKSCSSLNSNLTSIHSAQENDFVRNVMSSPVWIGLYNLNSANGSYEWLDGSSPSFTNWDESEPNNAGRFSLENCTELRTNGKWNDLNCRRERLSYVCGKEFNP